MNIKREILVTSNCATAGIALGLKALLPNTNVSVAPITKIRQMTPDQIANLLEKVDLWVTIAQTPEVMEQVADTPILRIPIIRFNAYHPDITYVMDQGRKIMKGARGQDYHSAIALWGYNNGLSREQTTALFCPKIYEALGYTRRWTAALKELHDLFSVSNLDFREFYPAVLEHAPFMHTLNHPRGEVIGLLTKLIAVSITGDRSLMKLPLGRIVQDFLGQDTYWPIYPGIAETYGLEGHYIWKLGSDTFLNGVSSFVSASYEAYESYESHYATSWIMPGFDKDFFDLALNPRVTRL